MSAENYKLWERIMQAYKPILNKSPILSDIAFTPHDFKHHCINIYKIASELIFPDTAYAYFTKKTDELLAFNIAVIVHDISMTDLNCDRSQHQLLSIEMIQKDYESGKHAISEISSSVFELVKDLIRAHSDIKKGNKENTLRTIYDEYSSTNPERVILCAAFRLADEMDITSDRIDMPGFAALKKFLDDNRAIIENIEGEYGSVAGFISKLSDNHSEFSNFDEISHKRKVSLAKDSFKHWDFCNYVKRIQFEGTLDDTLVVICSKDKISELGDEENILTMLYSEQKSLEQKINGQINGILSDLQKADMVRKFMRPVKSIKFMIGKEYLSTMVESVLTGKPDSSVYQIEDTLINKNIYLLKSELTEELKSWILDNKLLDSGHFRLNDKICSRDWILIDEIIQDKDKFDKIAMYFYHHIVEKYKDKIDKLYIIGLDFNGMLLASKLGFLLNVPFTYIVPKHSESYHGINDVSPELLADKSIVVIYDVLIDMTMFNENIELFAKAGREVLGIYSIFFREKVGRDILSSDYTIYTFNNHFDIEIINNINCKYRGTESCIRKNPIII